MIPGIIASGSGGGGPVIGGFVGGVTGTHTSDELDWSQSLTGLTGGLDPAPQEGDVVIVAHSVGNFGDFPVGVVTSGYTEIADLVSIDFVSSNLNVSYKIMGAVPDTEVTLIGGSSSVIGQVVSVHVWRGIDVSTPLDVTTQTATGIDTVLSNPPAITPTTEGATIISIGGGATTSISGIVEYSSTDLDHFITANRQNQRNGIVGMGSKEWFSGEFDSDIFGFTNPDHINYSWTAVTLALRPAP